MLVVGAVVVGEKKPVEVAVPPKPGDAVCGVLTGVVEKEKALGVDAAGLANADVVGAEVGDGPKSDGDLGRVDAVPVAGVLKTLTVFSPHVT